MFDDLPPRLPSTAIVDYNGLPHRLRYTEPAVGTIGQRTMCADIWLFPLGSLVFIPSLERTCKIIGKEGGPD